MDIANTLYKELVIEEKEFSSQMIGKVVLNAIENYLVSAFMEPKCVGMIRFIRKFEIM